MLNVIFYLKATKVNLNGESPVYARITHKHQSTTMATGKSMPKERWLFTNNLRNPLKAEKEKVIKKALEMYRLNLEKKFLELQKIDPDISLAFLKNEFSGVAKTKRSSITIGDIMEQHNVYFARKVEHGERAPASLQKYERAAELIKAFIKQQYNADNIAADEITSGFVYNLESYLKYDSNYRGKAGTRNNSVVKYMKIYKTACTYCIRMDLLDKNPFNVYDGKLSIMDAVFLTQQELNLIEKKRFVGRLEKVKDIFLSMISLRNLLGLSSLYYRKFLCLSVLWLHKVHAAPQHFRIGPPHATNSSIVGHPPFQTESQVYRSLHPLARLHVPLLR